MNPYLVQTPRFVRQLYPKRTWAFPNSENNVFLTFDDGPIPEVTPWVLDVLQKYNAKGTFFCIGDNIRKHPELFRRIISEGHAIGNHTFNHLNGRETKTKDYIENVLKADEEMVKAAEDLKSKSLFRPPYGKLTSRQSKILQKKGYRIVMWDILSADFDPKNSEENCLKNVSDNMRSGSIVVFHDSLKAEKNLRYTLPRVMDLISEKGLICSGI